MLKGIDISNHQGDIDFHKVKENGISFVMIRSSWGWFNEDTMFRTYVNGCESVGLPYGLYHYSYARNLQEAKIEADGIIQLAKSCHPSYPIAIDMEDEDKYKEKNGVSYDMCVQICEFICKKIEEAGYYAMIYSNLDWLNHKINDQRLDPYDKWVAQWAKVCQYEKEYGMWQYTNKEDINGVGKVDCNYAYKDYPSMIKTMEGAGQSTLDEKQQQMKVTYTVKEGDNLTIIAKKFGTTPEELARINYIINPNLIYPDQVLKITEDTKQNDERTYTVVEGDNLTIIAKKFDTTILELQRKNNISNPDLIYAGQVLKI